MLKPIYSILFLIGACLFNGCLKLEQVINLRPDGSGSLDLKYNLAESSVNQFRAMLQLRDRLAAARGGSAVSEFEHSLANRVFLNHSEEQVRNYLRTFEPDGIRVDTLRIQSTGGWRQTHLILQFDNLQRALQSDLMRDARLSFRRDRQGDYRLYRPPENTSTNQPLLMNDADIRMLSPMLAGFNVSIRLNVPERIVRSNAHRKDATTVQWVFDFDRNPQALTALQNQVFDTTFDGSKLNLAEYPPPASPKQ